MFGGGGDSGSSAARRTIVFGVCIGLAFILLLVAGLVSKNWLGMIMLLPLILVPVLIIILEAMGAGAATASSTPAKTAMTNFGQCTFGFLMSCLIGLPAVLFHTNSIDGLNFGLWLGATAIAMAGCVYYWSGRMDKEF